MSKHTRKLIMRCKHPTPCDLCLTDCKRAEVTAKENEIRSDLLDACKEAIKCTIVKSVDRRLSVIPNLKAAIAKATK